METAVLWIILILGGIWVFKITKKAGDAWREEEQRLLNDYRNALKGIDKSAALDKGRIYYAYLNRRLKSEKKPLADTENIISNDLKSMDNAYKSS
jgi:ABC-type siderophore export system fused ATPase/permease subunit